MINGKQLDGLCKVLNVFQDKVRMDCPIVVDNARIMLCEVCASDVFGIKSSDGLDIKQILNLKLEDEDFDVSIENDKYILKNDKRSYSFALKSNANIKTHAVPAFETDTEIETDAKTFLKAIEKCSLVCDNCMICNGEMISETDNTKVSVILGKSSECGQTEGHYSLSMLKKIAKVMTGKVVLSFSRDYPLKIVWSDGYYTYKAFIAPLIKDH